jgi:hypothetical protein
VQTPESPSPARLSWLIFAAAVLAGLGLLGDVARLSVQGRHAPVSHLIALPLLAFWIPAGLLFVAAAVVGMLGMLGRVEPRLSRLPLLALAFIGFVDLFILPDVRPMLPAYDVAVPLSALAEELPQYTTAGKLPTTVEELSPVAELLGSPSLLVDGVRPERWALVVRQGCSGPIESAPGTQAGTLLYCVSPDATRAWISAVALNDTLFGQADVARSRGSVLSVEARAPVAANPSPPAPPTNDGG